MATVSRSFKLKVPADKVWAVVGGFHNMHKWHPGIKRSEVELGGQQRALTLGDGKTIVRELMVKYDHKKRSVTYAMVNRPMPFTDYISTITIKEDGVDGSILEWSGKWKPLKGASAAATVTIIAGVYEGGYAGLKKKFKLS